MIDKERTLSSSSDDVVLSFFYPSSTLQKDKFGLIIDDIICHECDISIVITCSSVVYQCKIYVTLLERLRIILTLVYNIVE